MLRPHPIRRYLRTLQRNGNIAAHPESFKFEEQDFPSLAKEALSAARGLVEHLYSLKYRNEDLPDYEIAEVEDNSLRDMCYQAMIEGDIEATYLAGMYFKKKADSMNQGSGAVRAEDGFAIDAIHYIDQAMLLFKMGAKKNHPDCLFYLGNYQSTLRSTSKHILKEGEFFVSLASNLGNVEAQALMGHFYLHGSESFNQDSEAAREYYSQAAEQDHPSALAELGYMHSNGIGGEVDDAAAVRCLLRAAEAGYPMAQFNMYISLRKGKGVEINLEKALEWLNKAASQHLPKALLTLGQHIYAGEIPDRKPEEALEYFKRCMLDDEFRAISSICAAEILARQERTLKDWIQAAKIIQDGYEYAHNHDQLDDNMKTGFITVSTDIAQKLRAYISEHGTDKNLEGDDVLVCCLFDEHGVPITKKEEMMKDFIELMYSARLGADKQMRCWLRKHSFIKPRAQAKIVKAPRRRHLTSHGIKTGRNEVCICGSGNKFKKCCGKG